MSHHHNEHEHAHEPSYGMPTLVYICLLVCTALTVAVAGIKLDAGVSIILALAIATLKASLVTAFFMHLKYEDKTFVAFVAVALIILAVIMGFTFFDYGFRDTLVHP